MGPKALPCVRSSPRRPVVTPIPSLTLSLLACRILRVFRQGFLLPGVNPPPSPSKAAAPEMPWLRRLHRQPGFACRPQGQRLCKLVSKNTNGFGREAPRFARCYSGRSTEALLRSQQRKTGPFPAALLGHLWKTPHPSQNDEHSQAGMAWKSWHQQRLCSLCPGVSWHESRSESPLLWSQYLKSQDRKR